MAERKHTYRTLEQWQTHIDQQAQSGLSIQAYCKEKGLTASNFYTWRKKLSSSPENINRADQTAWVSLASTSADFSSTPSSTDISLTLPGGIVLTIRSH